MSDENGHVFISYARADGISHAEWFEAALMARGYKVWRDKRSLNVYQDFSVEIEKAIRASKRVVVLQTRTVEYSEKSFVRREILYAQAKEKPIIPVIFPDTDPITLLNHLTWVASFDEKNRNKLDRETALVLLLERLDTEKFIPRPNQPEDPFREYLLTLQENIIDDLDRRIIKQIDLRSEARPDAVTGRPKPAAKTLNQSFFGRGLAVRKKATEPAPEKGDANTFKTFAEAFEHYGGRVLLLGEPGAGKSTTLMVHARDAVSERLTDPTKPLPIPAILSAWPSHKPPPLAEWLAKHNHQYIEDHALALANQIREGKALLLLDGLDELGSSREEEIEVEFDENGRPKTRLYDPRQRFLAHIPANNQVFVTCRVRDYKQISEKADLNGAVTLQPLTPKQLRDYLEEYPNLWQAIEIDNALREMCSTPLLLSIFAYGFSSSTEEERKALQNLADSPAELRDRIFGMYVERRYEHEQMRLSATNENLPYTLIEIYHILGNAIADRLTSWLWNMDDTMLVSDNFPQNIATLITDLCQRLHYIIQYNNDKTNEHGWRFTHLLLLAHFGVPELVVRLNNSDAGIRNRAASALGTIGDPKAVQSLVTRLDEKDRLNRQIVANALVEIGEPAVPILISHLKNINWRIGSSITEILGRIGDSRAVAPLISCLDDTHSTSRKNIIEALQQLKIIVVVCEICGEAVVLDTINENVYPFRCWNCLEELNERMED